MLCTTSRNQSLPSTKSDSTGYFVGTGGTSIILVQSFSLVKSRVSIDLQHPLSARPLLLTPGGKYYSSMKSQEKILVTAGNPDKIIII